MEAEAAIAAHLRAARELIDKPKKWTKAISAVNKHGAQVPCDDPTATRFSIPGALRAASRPDDSQARDDAYSALAAVLADSDVILQVFNDAPKTTHADVLSVFDAAIARLEVRWLWGRLEL